MGHPVYLITNDVSQNTFVTDDIFEDPLQRDEMQDNLFKMRRL